MKKIFRFWMPVLSALVGGLLLTACGDDGTEPQGYKAAINVTTKSLEPNATGSNGESGTIKAFVGTVVTAEGFNLDQVTEVLMGETPCEIVEQTISLLKFKVPALDLAQSDTPYQQMLSVKQGEEVIFRYDYYVTIPVTDAIATGYSPASGTVGTVVKIEGRNLEQVTEIRFAGVSVLSDAFTAVVEGSTNSSVSFAVPAGEYPAGASEAAIVAVWGGSNEIDVTGETLFQLQTPKVEAMTQSAPSKIGDEITLTGEYLDLLSDYKWGNYEMIVLDGATAESVTLKFPSSIEATDPVVTSAALTAVWGTPAQTATLAAAWQLDTTPQGPAKPVLGELVAEEGTYLKKTVVVKGQNMASIEGFVVDGVEAALVGEPNDVEAAFSIPEDVTFSTATEVTLEAVYGGGTKVDFGTIKVYPYYYYKDVKLGLGSNSTKTYTQYASDNTFFLPDLGEVYSAQQWLDNQIDSYVLQAVNGEATKNVAISDKMVLDKTACTAEGYYGVMPYFFFVADSTHKLSMPCPSNSNSVLRNHCTYDADGKFTALLGAASANKFYGTPIMPFAILAEDNAWSIAVKGGTLETVAGYDGPLPGKGAPALGEWTVGSVLMVGYSTYKAGEKAASADDYHKVGFIHIKEVTCADLTTNKALESREGYILFDFYWSKVINE